MFSMEWPPVGAWPSSPGPDAAVSVGAAMDMGIEIIASAGALVGGPVTACMPRTPTTSAIPNTQRATALRVAPLVDAAVDVMDARIARQHHWNTLGG